LRTWCRSSNRHRDSTARCAEARKLGIVTGSADRRTHPNATPPWSRPSSGADAARRCQPAKPGCTRSPKPSYRMGWWLGNLWHRFRPAQLPQDSPEGPRWYPSARAAIPDAYRPHAMGSPYSPYVPVTSDFHKSAAWHSLRRRFKEHCRIRNAQCHLCVARGATDMADIDYVTPRTGRSFEADHLASVDERPDLALEWFNLRPSHQRCNRQRGSKPVEPQGEWCRPDW
jgi:5-methylcytosine-specific restriction endonuclease McrA